MDADEIVEGDVPGSGGLGAIFKTGVEGVACGDFCIDAGLGTDDGDGAIIEEGELSCFNPIELDPPETEDIVDDIGEPPCVGNDCVGNTEDIGGEVGTEVKDGVGGKVGLAATTGFGGNTCCDVGG